MSFWKIVAGVTVGVGAVAAAPFTGGGSILGAATIVSSLTGVGAIAAATAAGTAGAAAGYAMSKADEEKADEYRNEGRDEAKNDISDLGEALKATEEKLQDKQHYFDLLIALTAVGVATANCDGNICDEELNEINEFVTGVANSNLPESVKETIRTLTQNPPSISQAYELAKKLPDYPENLFDAVIDVVMHADGVVHTSEESFKKEWQVLNAA